VNPEDTYIRLRQKLDENYSWPCRYVFKFIVPAPRVEEVKALFPGVTAELRNSRNGKFVGVTVELVMVSSAEVIALYRKAASIKGIMSL
jgi:putative lipoic acid-binding regulatory protein